MCSCECCISVKSMHSYLLSWWYYYLKNSNTKAKIHNTEGLAKLTIISLIHIKSLWWLMVFTDIKQHLIWTWQQCVHIHHHIMHYQTVNVCYLPVPTTHVLIYQSNNHISIIKAHVLRYVFVVITSLHGIQCMEVAHWTKVKLLLVFAWYFLCDTRKTLHKKRDFYCGNIYFLLPHKFIHSRNTKISVSPSACTHSRYTSLWKHTPWSI